MRLIRPGARQLTTRLMGRSPASRRCHDRVQGVEEIANQLRRHLGHLELRGVPAVLEPDRLPVRQRLGHPTAVARGHQHVPRPPQEQRGWVRAEAAAPRTRRRRRAGRDRCCAVRRRRRGDSPGRASPERTRRPPRRTRRPAAATDRRTRETAHQNPVRYWQRDGGEPVADQAHDGHQLTEPAKGHGRAEQHQAADFLRRVQGGLQRRSAAEAVANQHRGLPAGLAQELSQPVAEVFRAVRASRCLGAAVAGQVGREYVEAV